MMCKTYKWKLKKCKLFLFNFTHLKPLLKKGINFYSNTLNYVQILQLIWVLY